MTELEDQNTDLENERTKWRFDLGRKDACSSDSERCLQNHYFDLIFCFVLHQGKMKKHSAFSVAL